MMFRKVLIFISAVFLFASCEFMNQKDNLIKNSEKETPVVYVDNGEDLTEVQTGVLVLNIAGTTARMIRPDDNLKLNDYSDWHVYFYGQANFDYVLENLKESFVLPVGNYNVLVTAVNKIEGKEGGDLILSSIQGKSEVEIVAGETASVCNILMERTKTEVGTGSFEYKFKISKFCFSAFSTKYNPDNPEQVIDFTPKNYVKASLNGLTVSKNYIFNGDFSDNFYVEVLSASSEDDQFYVFSLNGINIKSGFYRLKIDFETSNNTYIDSFDNETEFYTKALFEYPESLVEISDGGITYLDDTANEKIRYEEFNSDNPISLKELSKLLITCSKNDERVLKLPVLKKDYSSSYFPVDKINDIINKNGIKVDLTVSDTINDTDSLSENPYLYGVTFDYWGDLKIQNDFFKDCENLKYVRFNVELYPGLEDPSLTLEQNAFAGCEQEIIFEVPEIEIEIENPDDPDGSKEKIKSFGSYVDVFKILSEGNYKIESIQPYFDLFETK